MEALRGNWGENIKIWTVVNRWKGVWPGQSFYIPYFFYLLKIRGKRSEIFVFVLFYYCRKIDVRKCCIFTCFIDGKKEKNSGTQKDYPDKSFCSPVPKSKEQNEITLKMDLHICFPTCLSGLLLKHLQASFICLEVSWLVNQLRCFP